MLTLAQENYGTLAIYADGQLAIDEFVEFAASRIEFTAANAPVDMIVVLGPDFGGWSLDTLFRDATFSLAERGLIKRIAIVGDRRWRDWATGAMYAKLAIEIRFFLSDSKHDADRWLSSPIKSGAV